ncbi:hemagglutinin repeat-containing protein [Proteus mirabilis]|nr:hemagglutinin repeat-containing protein [Proteus mirabilis]ELJ9400674.1 hemagglutinin repeat-containing protein [Proteus mirabilis]ELJ9438567.1 hemagglutinin repeat-containing protein [Proteus mirabilis]ELS1786146.1 hemagglutinin repeat-containing protein [Proteus mirabilis]ELS1792913.1 hemagglutinin repeat-containing protein [Proteus mirabilis]
MSTNANRRKANPIPTAPQSQDSTPDSGNIIVVGSELKDGKDLSLSATQDINLVSTQNTELANDSSINPIQSVTGLL